MSLYGHYVKPRAAAGPASPASKDSFPVISFRNFDEGASGLQYRSRVDTWVFLGMLAGSAFTFYWMTGTFLSEWGYLLPSAALLIFFGFMFPVSYETAPDRLVLRAGMFRRASILYTDITEVEPSSSGSAGSYALAKEKLLIQYRGKKVFVAPEEQDAFITDIAMRSPHLSRHGSHLKITFTG